MKPLRAFLLVLPLATLSITGCVVTQTVDTHILDSRLDGPTTAIPVHITTPQTPNSVTLTPHLSFGPGKSLAGTVEGSDPTDLMRFYQYGQVPDHNLKWNLPSSAVGLDLDVARQSTAFSFGANYSSSGGSSRWGLLASFGTFSVNEQNIGLRLDLGVSFQGISQRTASVVITTTETSFFGNTTTIDTAYYLDTFTENRLGYFASLTFNSVSESFPVNFAFQAAFHRQTLIDFEPHTQVRQEWMVPMPIVIQSKSSGGKATTAASFISIAPTLAVDINPSSRIVGGARILWPVSENVKTPASFIVPFVRFDYIFK